MNDFREYRRYYDDELMHHGVLGMHWGIRRYQPYSTVPRKSGKNGKEIGILKKKKPKSYDQIIRERRAADVKNVRRLSDKDLNDKIERLKKEKQLKTLTAEDLHPGRTEVNRILGNSGKKVAGLIVTGATLYAIKLAVENGKLPKGMTIKSEKLANALSKIDRAELAKYLVKGGPGKR